MQNLALVISVILLIAVAAIGWFLFNLRKRVGILFGGKGKPEKADFQKALVGRLTRAEVKLEEMESRLNLVESIAKISVQKVGFLRFNPFQDTGGDQSFVIALLDREDNGFIFSSLYAREGVRVYAKEIQDGKPKHPLSEEEKKVLEKTTRKNF